MGDMQKYGSWAFILGVLIAILAAFIGTGDGTIILALAVLGLLVGLLNIQDKETTGFLVAAIALGLSSASLQAFVGVPIIGNWLLPIFNNIAVFIAPAAFIVALMTVWRMAKEA
jgi:hypothetical protein